MKNLPIIIFAAIFGGILIYLIIDKFFTLKSFRIISRKGTFKLIDRLLLYISIIGISVLLLWDFNYLKFSKPIPHQDWETISFKDFKGLRKPKESMDGELDFAYISSTIKVRERKNNIEIECLFHPCRSYVYNRDVFGPRFLEHEIYHFHITEYNARLMRKEIDSLIATKDTFNLRTIRDKYNLRENEMQYEYDEKTYHSYILGKQLEWQKMTDSLLFSLEDYSDPIISLHDQ